jgi:ribonuclease HI
VVAFLIKPKLREELELPFFGVFNFENLQNKCIIDIMKKVEIFTDGACSMNPGIGGWGAILKFNKHETEFSGSFEMTTNNRMELYAPIEALRMLKEPCEVLIYSDSAYLVNAFNQNWTTNWLKRNWMTADRKPVANRDLWEELIAFTNTHNITFIKVKGHADNEYNNRCDKLATDAIKAFKAKIKAK